MLHNNASGSRSDVVHNATTQPHNPAGLSLVPPPQRRASATPSSWPDLAFIVTRRCSSFFAEAAVLVLVFGILDYCLLKGRVEIAWITGALVISLGLLGASILMDFSAHRWIKAHP